MSTDLHDVVAIVLGGGRGSRLYPLTKLRTKPAVPVAGKYRLIDIPLSNCINSGIKRVFVLTQYLSASLLRHVHRTYKFDMFSRGWIDLLPAEQTLTSSDWYQGTADAVARQMNHFLSRNPRDGLILAGDHLYVMDYRRFIEFHRAKGADLTISVLPVSRADAPRFGVLKVDDDSRIVRFHEKPADDGLLAELESRPGSDRPYLGSMGIYVFKMDVLDRLLAEGHGDDFGKHVIPAAIESHRVYAYPFEGYWEDIGTISSFYRANLALTRPDRPFDLHDPRQPIYTRERFLPPSQVDGCDIHHSLIADGCRLFDATVKDSVIGLRSVVRPGAYLDRVIMMGADWYENRKAHDRNVELGRPGLGIGEGSRIERAIIDKNARIGRDVVIRSKEGHPDVETESYVIKEGFVVIPKNSVVPDGTVI